MPCKSLHREMYSCVNLRRSSLGIDYDCKSYGRSDYVRKLKGDLLKCGVDADKIDSESLLLGCGSEREQSNNELTKRAVDCVSERTASTLECLSEGTRTFESYECDQNQQRLERPKSLNSYSRSSPKNHSMIMRSGGFEMHNDKWEFEGVKEQQRPDEVEEKKEDIFDFDPFKEMEEDDPSVWSNQFPAFGDDREPSFSKDPFIQNKRKDDSSEESERSISIDRLKYELGKSRKMLEVERNKNSELQTRLQNMEYRFKILAGSQSTNGVPGQPYRLEEQVAFYRRECKEEKRKREDSEAMLQQIRLEKQTYEEQLEALIFEYIPNTAPKFKDIGPVNYDINESFHSVASYQLGRTIGEGHYGSVRTGYHTKKDQRFAVKILNKSNINRFKDLKQIAEEIHILKTYRHPNILYLEEVLHAPDNIYMVTELCYMDLHKYHNQIGLNMSSARQIIFGILQPLNHLHDHGIAHLDLKPENILITKSLDSHNASHTHVRICDFGLSNMVRKSDRNKDVILERYACGTPGFFAPEMILHEKFEGRTADMVSTRGRLL